MKQEGGCMSKMNIGVIVIMLILACLQGCVNEKAASVPGPALSWLHTEGNQIVDESVVAQVLRGVNRSGLEYNKKGNKISLNEVIYIIKEWKAQIIRLPFNQDWYTNDVRYRKFMDKVIGWIAGQGAYVMLDLQWQDTIAKITPIPNKAAIDMWKDVALTYKDNPAVLYDLHNEVHDTTWAAWRERASQIIEAIQSVHPKALIFVSGLDWAYDLRGWEEQPLPYNNIVYSSHPYPFKGEPWAWDEYFGNLADKAPVFLGEFGGGASDLEWGEKLLAYFDAKNLGWAAWSWVDQPHLTQKDRRTPTEFGMLVKNALLKHAEAALQ